IKEEIQRIENELKTLDAAGTEPPVKPEAERGKNMEAVNRYQIRELLKTGAYYERSEVKEFYEKFKNLRSVTGGELTIPTIVVDRILDILGDYCTVYPLVDKIRIKGKTRILIDTDTTPATWIEQTGAIPTGDVGAITNVDFDGYKVGKVTFVDNSILEDSIINLDDYVVKKLARALALALDKATLLGTGSSGKQPTGIIPSLEEGHKVSVIATGLADIVKPIGLIDTGEDSVGEIVAVMKRQTYYNRLLEYSIQTDSSGNVVGKLPNLKTPDLLGLPVVFNNNLPTDQILYGDFSKYTMVERESISIDKSEHVKFVEDQTGYRGKGRFDGKPTNKNAFVLVTLTDTPNA
ncbi:MAG: phage major capsid protein, partial [Clostridiales bacterium]